MLCPGVGSIAEAVYFYFTVPSLLCLLVWSLLTLLLLLVLLLVVWTLELGSHMAQLAGLWCQHRPEVSFV